MIPQYTLPMFQGATFLRTFNWYGGAENLAAIELITPGYPTIIKVTAHGLPQTSKTPMTISGVRGMIDLNTQDCKATEATYVTDDTFSVPISTVGKKWTTGSGEITWISPSDLTNYTAKMQIRPKVNSATVIHELTTENGGITLDAADGAINLRIEAADTAAFTFDSAVYDIDLIDASSVSTPVVGGTVTLTKEVTR